MFRRYMYFGLGAVISLLLFSHFGFAQITYFHQDFQNPGPYVNVKPDTGQFSHIIQTVPALSYSKFYKGHMDLVRTQQDSATGGIVRVMRATPFNPNPETLFIQITFSAENIQSNAVNAIYFYAGEDFDPEHNSFPGNALMFAKCALNFQGTSFTLKDMATLALSKSIGNKKKVTLTWILNNSKKLHTYQLFPGDTEQNVTLPGTYDLWVDRDPVSRHSKAYPGNSVFSDSKLSNFEIRFRNGIGKIRIYDILIREAASDLDPGEVMVAPNPVRDGVIRLHSLEVDPQSLQLINLKGGKLPIEHRVIASDLIEIRPKEAIASGIYVLTFRTRPGKKKSVSVMLDPY